MVAYLLTLVSSKMIQIAKGLRNALWEVGSWGGECAVGDC